MSGTREACGPTAIFDCKQSRADFMKDFRCAVEIAARLAKLHERRALFEEAMRPLWPSLRNAEQRPFAR